MILFCNLVCMYIYIYIYIHKICDDKFGDSKKSFSWLSQKVNKKLSAYGHDDADSAQTCLKYIILHVHVFCMYGCKWCCLLFLVSCAPVQLIYTYYTRMVHYYL